MPINWKKYINQTKSKPPRKQLILALEHVISRDAALDLGAGSLRDSKYLLNQNFHHVTAVDNDPTSEEISHEISDPRFTFVHAALEDFEYTPNSYDIINAQQILPYISEEQFSKVFDNIALSLKTKGIFTGQFFGDRDGWNVPGNHRIFFTKSQVQDFLSDFEIITFHEVDDDMESAMGTMKHFHIFDITARKK